MVFAHHVDIAKIFSPGRTGVSFFFILSGLVLGWSWREADTSKAFYGRRFARIYPSYFVGLILGVGLAWYLTGTLSQFGTAKGITVILMCVFLVQTWLPDQIYYFSINGVSWSLAAEAVFYAIFPFVGPRILKMENRRRLLQGVLVAWIFLMGAITHWASRHGHPDLVWFSTYFSLPRIAEFLLGITLVRDIRDRSFSNIQLRWIAVLIGVTYLLSSTDTQGFGQGALIAVPVALLLVRAAQDDLAGVKSWLQHPRLVWLGEISFCFYLVHAMTIRVVGEAFDPPKLVRIPLDLVLSVAAAAALHLLIEKPFYKRLQNRRAVR